MSQIPRDGMSVSIDPKPQYASALPLDLYNVQTPIFDIETPCSVTPRRARLGPCNTYSYNKLPCGLPVSTNLSKRTVLRPSPTL